MKWLTMLILIWMTFLIANINTFEINDKKINKESFQKMIEHMEKIRRLLRNMEEEDTDASESSGDDKSSERDESASEGSEESESGSESSEESGSGSESSEESGSGSESSEESGSLSESSGESGSGSESSEESGSLSESSEESGSGSESSEESGSSSESSEESGSSSESSGESGSPSESSPEWGSPSESGNTPSSPKSSSSSGSSKSPGSSSTQPGKSSEGNSTSSSGSSSSGQNTNPITTLPSPPVSIVDRRARIILLNFNSFYAPPLFVYLTFNALFKYINIRPARIVTFTISIVYYGFFRNLGEEKEIVEKATATCIIDPEDEDKIDGTCNYKCQAPKRNTTNSIVQLVGSPDFIFDNTSSSLNKEELTFSGEAALSFSNLQNQTFFCK